ncbi:MAG: exodeoxyribonuclease V subunit beta [Chitinivibrionales bacterium]|nr:exodeoxyribonuclease V subunit beta [Chitinivibrionales bacterium]
MNSTGSPQKTYPDFDILSAPLSGRILIEAGAGTGKTYTIACMFIRLILESKIPLKRILVVTFTEAATDELRARIREMLITARKLFLHEEIPGEPFWEGIVETTGDHDAAVSLLTDAINGFDEASLFTIHGFCRKILHDYAFESKALFNPSLMPDQTEYVLQVLRDFWRRHFYNESIQFIAWALSRDFSFEKLPQFWHEIHNHPLVTLLPETISCRDTEELEHKFEQAYSSARDLWLKQRKDITGLLLHAPGLNRNRYRTGMLQTLILELDNWFNAGLPLLPLPKNTDRITRSRLSQSSSLKKNSAAPRHGFFLLCDNLEQITSSLSSAYERRIIYYRKQLFSEMQSRLPALKREHGVISFDDLLNNVYSSLTSDDGTRLAAQVQSAFSVALIDEFQDTDPIQYEIFNRLFPPPRTLFLIGDPKQSIYAFRGADIFSYLKAKQTVSQPYGLTRNWRSVNCLIDAINALFSKNDNPFCNDDIPYQCARAAKRQETKPLSLPDMAPEPLQLWFAPRDLLSEKGKPISKGIAHNSIIKAVTGEISKILSRAANGEARIGERPIRASDIAVLVRKKTQTLAFQESLSRCNIPCVIYSDANLFDSPEAREVYTVLAAIASLNDESLLKAAMVTSLFGIDGNRLFEISHDDTHWERWLEKFSIYHDLWHTGGFIRMFSAILSREGVRVRLLGLPNGERRLTNVLHCGEIIHTHWASLGPSEIVRRLGEHISPLSLRNPVYQLRLERDENAVSLVTIHKSKGLEYPIVFAPFSWEGISRKSSTCVFHDPGSDYAATCDLGSGDIDIHRQIARNEALAEDIRLLYVAVTRARYRCYLVWGYLSNASISAMTWLFHTHQGTCPEPSIAAEQAFLGLDSDDTMRDDIRALDAADDSIALRDLPAENPEPLPYSPHENTPGTCREFSGTINTAWSVSSFSSLTARRHQPPDMPDYDSLPLDSGTVPPAVTADDTELYSSIFTFPRGTKAGSFFHSILETIDFASPDESQLKQNIESKLDLFGYDRLWNTTVFRTIRELLHRKIPCSTGTVTLKEVPLSRRLTELEFYFPADTIDSGQLARLFSQHTSSELARRFPEKLEQLRLSQHKGFIKGYIDCIFEYHNRFYLVDWKSNYLGDSIDDYADPVLYNTMCEEYYIIQYHLYLVALHRYLQNKIPSYEYDTHFGDVLYVFLRGIGPTQDTNTGFFIDRPSQSFVEKLSDVLGDSEGDSTA